MKNHHRFVLLSVYLVNVIFGDFSLAQSQKDDKLGQFSRSNPFVFVSEEYKKYGMSYRFTPKNDKVKAYYTDGTFTYLPENAEIRVASIERGQFDHKKGLWVEFFAGSDHKLLHSHINSDPYHVFLNDLIDIEAKSKAADKAEAKARKESVQEERWDIIKSISPYALIFFGLIALIRRFSKTTKSTNGSYHYPVNSSSSGSGGYSSTSYDYTQSQNSDSTNSSQTDHSWVGSDEFNRQRDEAKKRQDWESNRRNLDSEISRLQNRSNLSYGEQQELDRLKHESGNNRWYGL